MRCLRAILASALLAGVLSACSESEASPPTVEPPEQKCRAAERSLYAEEGPAGSIRKAMRHYLPTGGRLTIQERHSGTAIVLVERRDGVEIRAELVKAGGGWVRTSVVRCD